MTARRRIKEMKHETALLVDLMDTEPVYQNSEFWDEYRKGIADVASIIDAATRRSWWNPEGTP